MQFFFKTKLPEVLCFTAAGLTLLNRGTYTHLLLKRNAATVATCRQTTLYVYFKVILSHCIWGR